MRSRELREDWFEVVLDHLGEDLKTIKGRSRKDPIAAAFGKKTEGEVFDRPTMITLYRLITRNVLQSIDYPISTGKEANVFHATEPRGTSVAVKIFRVHTATFHSYLTYIQGDPRFEQLRTDRRALIHAWVKKEYKNLLRMHDAGVRVPRPILWADNVLVMEFIGAEGTAAPLLKDAELASPAKGFEQLGKDMEAMWNKAGLVHGDLSEYNVMVQREGRKDLLTVIDVGQAVMQKHPMAREFLDRDAKNVARWFKKQGVEGATPQALLDRVLKGELAQQAERAGHPETKFEPEDPEQHASIALDQEEME